MVLASILRAQRVIRVAGCRLYSDATFRTTSGSQTNVEPLSRRLVRHVLSRRPFESTTTNHKSTPREKKVSSVKIANSNGIELNHPLLSPGLRDGDELRTNDTSVQLPFVVGERTVPRLWLRDNCPCPKCRRRDTLQREVDIFSLDGLPESRAVVRERGLEVTWNTDHIGLFPWEWLVKHKARDLYKAQGHGLSSLSNPVFWTADSIKDNPPSVQFDEVMASDKGVGEWTKKIREFGFCFVNGVPVCPHKTQELLERISFVRPTHYGGFYDFTSDLTMKDTAYTSEAIGPHTDTTYFTEPAGLQMFHLLSHEDGAGGASLLVDGYRAAQELDKKDREVLAAHNISWHASGNDGINIIPSRHFPVIYNAVPGALPLQIRWNNADRRTINPAFFEKWAKSAKAFNDIVNDVKMQYWEQLQPGRALIFDNWRILHGRSAFTGKRRMCGGYINHDDFWSRWLNTNYTREQILDHIL